MSEGADFDKDTLEFKEEKTKFSQLLKKGFKWFILCSLLALVYYTIFLMFFSTEQEKKIILESRAIQENLEYFENKVAMLDEVVGQIQSKDREVYSNIFNASPPSFTLDNDEYEEFLRVSDTLDYSSLIWKTSSRIASIWKRGEQLGCLISELEKSTQDNLAQLKSIPSIVPIDGFTESKTGATIGKRIHPFYKTITEHTGLDLVTNSGSKVFATADGVVKSIQKLQKGKGNHIQIDHQNGYITEYSHLSSINVKIGQRVKRGAVIGRVGTSGTVFAPHLHYEVMFNGQIMNPIDYFFSDLGPQEYRKVMMIAVNTGQSLD